jgi:hypothetical protein
MFQTSDPNSAHLRHPGDLVIHGDQATLFGPVGTPVPAQSRMGVPQATNALAATPRTGIRTAPSSPRSGNAAAAPAAAASAPRVAAGETPVRPGLRWAGAGGR